MKRKRLIIMVLSVLILCMSLGITAFAKTTVASGNAGSLITWTLDSDGLLSFNGKGAVPNYTAYTTPWHEYSKQIKKVTFGSGITGIGDYLFWECNTLESVTCKGTIKRIGFDTFGQCSNLKSFTLQKSYKELLICEDAFIRCESLEKIQIPYTTKSLIIGPMAFWDCKNLNEISTFATAYHFYDSAFSYDTNLVFYCIKGGAISEYADSIGIPTANVYLGYTLTCKASAIKGGLKITATKINKMDGYEIKYSTKSSMKNAKTIKSTSNKCNISNLGSKKRYYIQVRTYKKINGKVYYSKWSSKIEKKTK